MNADSPNNDNLFFHYTNIDSALKILSTGLVWASDCRYLNDRNELKTAEKILLGKIKQKYHYIDDNLIKKLTISMSELSFFLFSLSRSGSILSQWKSYADDGRGVCLGFKKQFIINSTLESGPQKNTECSFLECVYSDHTAFIDDLIERNDAILQEIIKEAKPSDLFLDRDASEKLKKIQIELMRIKHEAFFEEQEYRLVMAIRRGHAKMRVSADVIIPYIEMRVFNNAKSATSNECAIPKIWLGPKCDGRNKMALAMFGKPTWLLGGVQKYDCGYR